MTGRRRTAFGTILVVAGLLHLSGVAEMLGGIGLMVRKALLWSRLPLQFVFMTWAWVLSRSVMPLPSNRNQEVA